MFATDDIAAAARLIDLLRARKLKICTAESCTGGLIAALLTEVPGASNVVDRGYVTYSNGAKCDLLDVPATLIGRYGAVSAEVALAMATGAVRMSGTDLAVAVTGIAGPGGGSTAKPVGLVHVVALVRGGLPIMAELRLGAIDRSAIRLATVREALALCTAAISQAA